MAMCATHTNRVAIIKSIVWVLLLLKVNICKSGNIVSVRIEFADNCDSTRFRNFVIACKILLLRVWTMFHFRNKIFGSDKKQKLRFIREKCNDRTNRFPKDKRSRPSIPAENTYEKAQIDIEEKRESFPRTFKRTFESTGLRPKARRRNEANDCIHTPRAFCTPTFIFAPTIFRFRC